MSINLLFQNVTAKILFMLTSVHYYCQYEYEGFTAHQYQAAVAFSKVEKQLGIELLYSRNF